MTQLNPLAVSAASLLRTIAAGTAATRTELAEQAGRQRSNIARDLGQLAAAGLITADQMPELTHEGYAQLNAITLIEIVGAPADHAAPPTQLLHGQITPDPDNARRDWDSEDAIAELAALADDIRENGLLQNLVVRPLDPVSAAHADSIDGQHVLVGGERRWRAIGLLIAAGHWRADQRIPVRVLEHDEDLAVRFAALAENLQRRDLNPIEEAQAFQALRTRGVTTSDIADRVGKTQRHVQMRLQLLECLTPDQQARMTLPEGDPKRLSVRDARTAVQAAEARRKARDAFEVDWTDRQRLILTEMRLRQLADSDVASLYSPIPVDPDAMAADPDARALAEGHLIGVPDGWDLDGRACARLHYRAGDLLNLISDDIAEPGSRAALFSYATFLGVRTGLISPTGHGERAIPWLNGPFTPPPEALADIARRKAERDEQQAEYTRQREANLQAMRQRAAQLAAARTNAEGLLAVAGDAGNVLPQEHVTAAAAGSGLPLPWRATDKGRVLAANGEQVVSCAQPYIPADDGDVAAAILIATTANAAAGLVTPPLEVTEAEQAIDGSDPEAGDEGDTDTEQQEPQA